MDAKQRVFLMVLRAAFSSFLRNLTKRIKTFFMRLSIGLFFLLFGTYYVVDSIITLLAENLGVNLEYLRLIAGVAMLLGSFVVLNHLKK